MNKPEFLKKFTEEEISGMIFVNWDKFEKYQNFLPPHLRYTNSKVAEKGLENLTFKGVPVVPISDEDMKQLDLNPNRKIGNGWEAEALLKMFESHLKAPEWCCPTCQTPYREAIKKPRFP